MSKADEVFVANIKNILENGYDNTGEKVRTVWPDGVPAHTKSIFGVVNRYNLAEEFPILTLRRTFWKSAWDELSWIWQKKSNRVSELKSHIWDQWVDENGTIGKAYGFQLGKIGHYPEGDMDQVDYVIWKLTHDPGCRRIITSLWNPDELRDMGLEPCAWSVTFNVKGNKLNILLTQRSQDMLAASAWNTVQYAMLCYAMASAYGFEPGEMVHVIADCHIYDRHLEIAKELIQLPQHPAPKLWVDPSVKSFYDFTVDSFKVLDYQYNAFNKKFDVAI